ncbi:MAG: hypothetical protein LBM38_00675 [Clostridiales bacterium]|jgi:hypothetical protein|nr:hypothetical protein [Clostridiales bacterium]
MSIETEISELKKQIFDEVKKQALEFKKENNIKNPTYSMRLKTKNGMEISYFNYGLQV